MKDCLFCKMAAGEMKPQMVLETPELIAFRDIKPQAPLHVLIVPRKHIATLNDTIEADAFLAGKMLMAAQDIARKEGVAKNGYRLVMNCNADGGQTVFHIHMHLLAGRQMEWPPG
ncbi:MAG TPA: histidine triad nucleotide-binding protein [Gammaproteobacteria bacterium]|jgi:histidine triad (HIT) family protein|nr:histidine triad nucleotide-binding protein [Gammaproteobacteria bacterium]